MRSALKIAIFIAVVLGLIWLITGLFGGSGSNTKKSETKSVVLTDYAETDSKVILTQDGRVNGDDVHRSIRITITPTTRVAQIVQGYQGNVIGTQDQENNKSAYDEFIRALARTGFGKERKVADTDVRGVCASGQRYIYEVVDKGSLISRTWGASCIKGTSPANASQVMSLFQAQITDYSKFTSGVSL